MAVKNILLLNSSEKINYHITGLYRCYRTIPKKCGCHLLGFGGAMSRITEKQKLKEERGTGFGKYYKPWILVRDLGSDGTSCVFRDWKHGRQIQCLSQGEAAAYRLLRWRDDVIDIREQFPLDLKLTTAIARRLGLPHPHNRHSRMTTDFLVTYMNPEKTYYLKAYTVKPNEASFTTYALKNHLIEQTYWGIKGVHLEVIYADYLDKIFAENIYQCVQYYDLSNVENNIDMVKYLIAQKRLTVDMKTDYLNFRQLAEEYVRNKDALIKIFGSVTTNG